jgi:hypothetical protein
MRVINCYRAHGLPNYPDPTYDPGDGRWHYPIERPALTGQARQACASAMPQATPASPIPSAQLADLLKFASCVRAHGAPNWPDPGVDGVFRSDSVLDVKGDPSTRSAAAACDQYLASSGGNISVSQPHG